MISLRLPCSSGGTSSSGESRATNEVLDSISGEGGALNDWLVNIYDLYERATDDEERAINVDVTCEMSREDVVKRILQLLS